MKIKFHKDDSIGDENPLRRVVLIWNAWSWKPLIPICARILTLL